MNMSKIIIITIITVILIGGSLLLFKNGFGSKEVSSTPDTQVKSMVEEIQSQIPTPTPNPTPVPTKLDIKVDLNKELEIVNPEVLDSDFSELQSLISFF